MKTLFARCARQGLIWAIFALPLLAEAAEVVTAEQAAVLAPEDFSNVERYLTGDYSVTISSGEARRAVLRPLSRGLQLRVIIVYPAGFDIPKQGGNVTLAAEPGGVRYRISTVRKDENGISRSPRWRRGEGRMENRAGCPAVPRLTPGEKSARLS